MITLNWIYLLILIGVITALFKPIGIYLYRVLDPQGKTFLDPVLRPLEKLTYAICKIDPKQEHTWKQYLGQLLLFSFVSFICTFAILYFQALFPLNPQRLEAPSFDLCFNTAISFLTNTNWQAYAGESTMSYFSQMFALTVQNFLSPAVGLCVASALIRGIAREGSKTLGNFWVDLTRIIYYVMLPLSIILAVVLIQQGVPQNFSPYAIVETVEAKAEQIIVQGPIASQEAIKLLGTNGGGYTNANSAHPYENPTPLANYIEILALLLIATGQIYYFGYAVRRPKHAWSIYGALVLMFIIGVAVCTHFEKEGMPWCKELGLATEYGNYEGKEVRFGVFPSTLFATATTASSSGAVNSTHTSFTPIGGLIPMLNIQLGEVIFGGIGSGLYSVLIFVILSVFIVGLIIGRTPEYFGKRLEAFDVKMCVIALFVFFLVILGFTAWAVVSKWGVDAMGNRGPHGFSEVLYAYSSTAANNGSGFASLSANTPWYNYTLAAAMVIGRFGTIIPVVALAGSMLGKKRHPETASSFPVTGATFSLLLVSVIMIIGALTFLPALVLGPILEQVLLISKQLF